MLRLSQYSSIGCSQKAKDKKLTQHDAFLYLPGENRETEWHDDARMCNVYFPSYYPDGDYYFFIAQDFSYGILGHPWRKELYIFGEKLIAEFEKCEDQLLI